MPIPRFGRSHSRSASGASGFTLLELMITLAIAAILATVAVPAYQNMVQQNTMAAVANNLIAALNYTRSEAITRVNEVSICPRKNETECGSNWLNGWLVFAPEPNANKQKPTQDNLLRVHGPVTFPGLVSDNSGDNQTTSVITFDGSGFATGSATTITLSNTRTKASLCVSVSFSGIVDIARAEDTDEDSCTKLGNG